MKYLPKVDEKFGLAFEGRGFDVSVIVPLGKMLNEGLLHTADKCASSCQLGHCR